MWCGSPAVNSSRRKILQNDYVHENDEIYNTFEYNPNIILRESLFTEGIQTMVPHTFVNSMNCITWWIVQEEKQLPAVAAFRNAVAIPSSFCMHTFFSH